MAEKGRIVPYKKVCEIKDGGIVRMFWEHPSGNDEFSVDEVLEKWRELAPLGQDFTEQQWLTDHGFYPSNVIRDGYRPPS